MFESGKKSHEQVISRGHVTISGRVRPRMRPRPNGRREGGNPVREPLSAADALPIFRKGIYSSCESSAKCIRRATRLAASDAGDERVCTLVVGYYSHIPRPSVPDTFKLDNQCNIPAAPTATLSQ